MPRLSGALVVALLAVALAVPSAVASQDRRLGDTLGEMWETILETPSPENPYVLGPVCLRVDAAVAPFSPDGSPVACTVKPGTNIFVAAWSSECSTLEGAPYFGANAAELRACAIAVNDGITSVKVTLDGIPVAVTRVTSGVERLTLPADNILGAPAGSGTAGDPYLSVANGWVSLLHPLAPGRHTIVLDIAGASPPDTPRAIHNVTTIIVKR